MPDTDPNPLDHKLLSSYLNDHLAGSTAGLELARRALSQNRGTRFGEVLERIVDEIADDRRTLELLMEKLDVGEDHKKVAAGWLGEKAGRLKLNGRLLGYSPLSRLIELEGLVLGVSGKLALWKSLRAVADLHPVLDELELDALIERARGQIDALEHERLAAAELALTGSDEVPEPVPPATA
jgi:hypothetical protein